MDCPNYLWGEAVRHATYLINRVATRVLISKTPYEALKNNKPNVDHLRIFGCVGYAKVDTPHLKKLDDRSRALVHLGTEPGMKPYRLYDPITRRVIVNRDVILMKTRSGTGAMRKRLKLYQEVSALLSVTLGTKESIGMIILQNKEKMMKSTIQKSSIKPYLITMKENKQRTMSMTKRR